MKDNPFLAKTQKIAPNKRFLKAEFHEFVFYVDNLRNPKIKFKKIYADYWDWYSKHMMW